MRPFSTSVVVALVGVLHGTTVWAQGAPAQLPPAPPPPPGAARAQAAPPQVAPPAQLPPAPPPPPSAGAPPRALPAGPPGAAPPGYAPPQQAYPPPQAQPYPYPPGYAPPAQGYPPPGYYAPPPGYAPPGYAMPPGYGYGLPGPIDPRYAPRVQSYDDGPVPPGFHTEERARSKILVTGVSILAGAWGISAISAGALLSDKNTKDSAALAGLFVPVAGPFITLGGTHTGSNDTAFPILLLDGIAQIGGLTLIIVGLAAKETVLVRDGSHARVEQRPKPELMVGARGASVRVAF